MNFAAARQTMLHSQVRPNGVTDPGILDALGAVPREAFVPEGLRRVAYVDEELPVGHGRFVIAPMVLGRLLNAAAVRPGDVALDLACGSGYSTAVLARVATTVVAVESDPGLAETAASVLGGLGVDNAAVETGDPAAGYPSQAPFDVIVIAGAVRQVPNAVRHQLDGGRLVTIHQEAPGVGRGTVITRSGDAFSSVSPFDDSLPLLPEFDAPSGFVL